ncbi:MAG: FGGY family carbohydrate kinase [Oscillospiraceae bacterium]|nr:FGGY family carbohydrate kinase [Oscillospiraceae bacterium]
MYIGVDLGTTNIKAAVYDGDLRLIDRQSMPVSYLRENGFVEFDAARYCADLTALLGRMARGLSGVRQIAFTGQAESLVCVDRDGNALMNAISWMDERSQAECAELAARFPADECERVTGQQAVLPTWPATKILWLRRNRPDVFQKTAAFLLLKDYIVYKLTGVMAADMSIATFTFYFDIYQKRYWREMLDAVGIPEDRLPPLAEPCTAVGRLTPAMAAAMGLGTDVAVNIGTLDHFAGMIGTGNVSPGGVTLSTGTVMALTAMAAEPAPRNSGIAMHYGFLPDTHVMLPVAESGGVSLEWFRRTCMGDIGYDEMNRVLLTRALPGSLLFLPYLVGTNAPEFDRDASGVFFGLRQEHDVYDMAGAVMEGVAYMLRKNCDHIRQKGTEISRIIATGGGAKSPVWCQLQADITGLPVVVPAEKEAACLGAAMIAAVSDGRFPSYRAAADACAPMSRRYEPRGLPVYEAKYQKFLALYDAALRVARM